MDLKNLHEIWGRHKGKALGIFLGLFFGWFTITYGILKAAFVAVCAAVGYYVGTRLDDGVNLWKDLSRIFKGRG